MAKNIICGRNTIVEVYKKYPSSIIKLYLSSSSKKFIAKNQASLLEINAEIKEIEELDKLANTQSHQGVVAKIERQNLISQKELLIKIKDGSVNKILALDSIQDPQNFGAILRSAEFFGIDAVLWSSSRSVSLSPLISKVSMGGSEILTLVDVGNLGDFLIKIKEANVWTVLADVDQKAQNINQYKFSEKTCLVLGQEGKGVSTRVKKLCDESIFIERRGDLQSLNVSNASAIFLYKLFN